MLGLDMMDLVPPGTIQDMVRLHGPDLIKMLMQQARRHFALGPNERMSFQLVEAPIKGEETVVCIPLVVDATTLQTVRKLPYYDLVQLVASAPVAEWVRTGKEVKRASDKVEPLLKKLDRARADGDAKAVEKLERSIDELLKPLPAGVRRMLGYELKSETKALPAAPEATAAGTGGEDAATDE